MHFEFKFKKLETLYTEEKGAEKYEKSVVNAFFIVMARISAANSVQDLRNLKSRRLEKLEGKPEGRYSMRLNDQWRLLLTIEKTQDGIYLQILEISDHYKK
jgi:toxin HigB-1